QIQPRPSSDLALGSDAGLAFSTVQEDIVTNMESSLFPAMQVLWLGREFYKVKHGVISVTVMAPLTLATNRWFPKMQPFSRYFY
ncbi:hypothetical protein AVEN_133501-1, partial [Araneus ventricosus]